MAYDSQVTYSKILCPVDFSDTSRHAFYKAVGYANVFQAKLVILHVREHGRSGPQTFEEVENESETLDRLEEGLVRRLNELQDDQQISPSIRAGITLEIRTGKPFLEILRFASQDDVDLIVMGTHGYTGFKHLLIGSQAERVVRRAPCDVVCVKPADFVGDVSLLIEE